MADPQDFESFLQSSQTASGATPAPAAAAPAPVQAVNPFESFLADQKQQSDIGTQTQAQGIATANSQGSADAAGRAAQIGRQIGVPGPAVETDPARFESQAKAQTNANIVAGNPKLAGWVVDNPFSAKVAQDQMHDMNNIDVIVGNQLLDTGKDVLTGLVKGIGSSFAEAGLAINRGIAQGIANQTGFAPTPDQFKSDWWYQHMIAPMQQNVDATKVGPEAPFGARVASTVGSMLGTLVQIMGTGGASAEAQAVEGGASVLNAVGQQVAHGARAMTFPALTSALNTGKEVYDQTGSAQQAVAASTAGYGTALLGGVVPLGAAGNLATRLATGAVSGIVTGEVNRQAMNFVLPQAQGFDAENAILNGIGGAMLSGAMGQSPLHDAVRQAFSDGIAAETAQRGGESLQQLSELSAASKLRASDPQAFHGFVERMSEDGQLQNVYVDGETFRDALHQSQVDPDQIPGLNDRINEAVATGGDVQIPVADYATHIAGTDLDKAILPELKVEEGGMTAAEGEQFFANAKEEMAARAKEIADQEASPERSDVQKIGDTLLEQMQATGRFPADVARASLAPVTEFYRTMAERTGMTPGELYEQFPLKIAGENPAADKVPAPESPLAKLSDTPLLQAGDIGPGGYLREGQVSPADWKILSDAGLVEDIPNADGTTSPGVNTEHLYTERDRRSSKAKENRKSVSNEERARGMERRADNYARVAKEQEDLGEIGNSEQAKEAREKESELRAQASALRAESEPESTLNQHNRGGYSPDTKTIGLLKDADLSTFLHESGHFFLDTLADLASRPDAPGPLRDDMQTAISWMGGKDLADWNGRTLEEQRDMHEKFARGFETYLMEGKAPTLDLQSLFSRFRSWLINVYRSVTSLGAELTPEVRGVFDRLLASDDAIRQAEAMRGYANLDLSKTDATDAQKASYEALGDKATQDAITEMAEKSFKDVKWQSRAKSEVLKQLQAEADEARGMVRAEAEKEVMDTPVEQARAFIQEANLDLNPERRDYQNDLAQWNANRDEALDSARQAWIQANPEPSITPEVSGNKPNKADRARYNEQRKEWTAQRDEALKQSAEQWDQQNPKPVKPETMADQWKKERAATEKETADQVKSEYLARPEAQDLVGIKKGQYLARMKREMANETERRMLEWEQQHPRPDSNATRIDPDLVAEQFGFGSGKELVEQLRAATPEQKIDALTDQRMLERHGELVDPQAREDAANAAIANESRARHMATGLKLLAKSPIPTADLVKAATEAANTAIAGKQIKEVKPRQYEVAETKANREALEQAPKNPAEAVKAQRQALLSNRLAKAARDALAGVAKIVANQKRYDKASVRAKMDPDILDQIDALRERFDFRQRPTNEPTKAETSLKTWVDSQKSFGYTPVEHPGMMDPTVRMPYKDMTVEQIRGFNDTIRSMEQIGRERKSITVEGKKVDLAEAVNEMIDKMKEQPDQFTVKDLVQPPRAGVDPALKVMLNRMSSFMRASVSELKPQQFKANQFDRQELLGPFSKMVFNRVFDANYRKIDMLKSLANEFREASKNLGKEWQESLRELVPNHTLQDADLTEEHGQTVYRQLTRGDMLGIARHVGNESNFDKLTKGMGWAPDDVWKFLSDNMTAKDWEATQATWNAFEKHWPEMVEMNRRLGNASPDRIEPRPFRTADGIEMKGGYAPIDYDPLRSKLAVKQSDASAINPSEGLFGKGYFRADTTTNGSLNSRVAGYYDRLNLDANSIERRLHDTIHDLAYREALLDVHKILSDQGFRRQFQLTYGPEQYKAMQEWIGDIANGQNTDAKMSRLGQIMQATRHMVVANGIALRVSTMIKHGGSAAFKSAGYFSGSAQKYFLARAGQMATDHEGQTTSAIEKFSEIRARAMQQDRDYKQTTASLFNPESFQSKAERFGHAGVAYLDLLSAVPTAWGAYDRAINEGIPKNRGGTGKPMSDADATAYANQIVREAHGSNIESARAAILTSDSELTKMFTMMYGFMNNSLGQVMDMKDKLNTAGFSKPEVLARFMMASIVPALAAGIVEKPHKDEAWYEWAAKAITGEFAGMVPGIRDAYSAMKGYNTAGLAPLMQTLSAAGKPFKDAYQAAQGKAPRAPIRDAGNAIGLFIPGAGQVGSTLQYAADLSNGKAQPKGPVDVVRGLALGQNNQ